jgi:hypothetical protein
MVGLRSAGACLTEALWNQFVELTATSEIFRNFWDALLL